MVDPSFPDHTRGAAYHRTRITLLIKIHFCLTSLVWHGRSVHHSYYADTYNNNWLFLFLMSTKHSVSSCCEMPNGQVITNAQMTSFMWYFLITNLKRRIKESPKFQFSEHHRRPNHLIRLLLLQITIYRFWRLGFTSTWSPSGHPIFFLNLTWDDLRNQGYVWGYDRQPQGLANPMYSIKKTCFVSAPPPILIYTPFPGMLTPQYGSSARKEMSNILSLCKW